MTASQFYLVCSVTAGHGEEKGLGGFVSDPLKGLAGLHI